MSSFSRTDSDPSFMMIVVELPQTRLCDVGHFLLHLLSIRLPLIEKRGYFACHDEPHFGLYVCWIAPPRFAIENDAWHYAVVPIRRSKSTQREE